MIIAFDLSVIQIHYVVDEHAEPLYFAWTA
jgi:hypothetical protein